MMDLADKRKPVICHAFSEVELPHWTSAVEWGTGDLSDDLVEFPPPAGGGYFHSPQVIVKVNFAVLQPHGVMQPPGNVDKQVAKWVEQVQSIAEGAPEQIEVELTLVVRRVYDCDLQRVRVQVGRLAIQQHCIHAVEPLHRTPARRMAHSIRMFAAGRQRHTTIMLPGRCESMVVDDDAANITTGQHVVVGIVDVVEFVLGGHRLVEQKLALAVKA
jgi:hypothetical protein